MWLLALFAILGDWPVAPPCGPAPVACQLSLPDEPTLRAMLGDRKEALRVEGDRLTVVALRSEPAMLCCAIQTRLNGVNGDLQAVSLRVPNLRTAIFDVRIMPGEWAALAPVYRGPAAPPAPAMVALDRQRLKMHRIQSRYLGLERAVQVYLPPDQPAGERVPVIYLADGFNPDFGRVADALYRAGLIRPLFIVGLPSAQGTGDVSCAPRCDPRSREYLIDIPDAAPEELRFDAHVRFVAEEVMPLIEANHPVRRDPAGRATMGYSSGGSWALTMASRYPGIFGRTIALSVGWMPAAQEARRVQRSSRVFLGAGQLEGGHFLERTRLAAANARSARASVRLITPNAGHAFENWLILFSDAVRWHFPR